MKHTALMIVSLVLAALACTLSTSGDDPATPTPVAGIGQPGQIPTSTDEDTQTTQTAQTPTRTVSIFDVTATPVAAPPTRLPTLLPTPQQFNTPVTAGGGVAAAGDGGSTGVGVADASGVTIPSMGQAAQGAPQTNGYYFPDRIVYEQGEAVQVVGSNGDNVQALGRGRVSRSLNGLFVSLSSGAILRPDGATVTAGGGRTTFPTWSRDGNLAYWGNGSQLIRYQNGAASPVESVNGDLIAVEYAPDESGVLFGSRNQIKILHADGRVEIAWESSSETVVNGPYWIWRNDGLGIYVELDNGRRLSLKQDGLRELNSFADQLSLASPIDRNAYVYVRSQQNGYVTLVAVWPGVGDVPFEAKSLESVSWSPTAPQLVFAAPSSDLVWLDVTSGERRVLVNGQIDHPRWTPPQYRLP